VAVNPPPKQHNLPLTSLQVALPLLPLEGRAYTPNRFLPLEGAHSSLSLPPWRGRV